MVSRIMKIFNTKLVRSLWRGNIFEKTAKIAVLVLVALHFLVLIVSPPGFYIDEAATGSHVSSMIEHQTNANGQSWPIFSESLGGGYTTPTYLYPLTIWSMAFGDSEYSLRAFSQFVTILAILFIGLSAYLWLDKKAMLTAWLVGLTLPWAWLQGSLAWDPALVPLFVGLMLFGFSLIEKRSQYKLWGLVVFCVSSVGLAYTYPPTRIMAPILLAAGMIYLLRRHKITFKDMYIGGILCILAVLPLAIFMVQPDALYRSQQLSAFHNVSFINGMAASITNFIDLFNPSYLFLDSGDNLRHGVGTQGMLGLASLICMLGAIYFYRFNTAANNKRYIILLLISALGIALAYIGSALTNEGQPHYLRACAAWPFYVILITVGWSVILSIKSKVKYLYVALAALCTIFFILNFAFIYPNESKEYFDYTKRQHFSNGKTDIYPDIVKKYYQR
jgi:4-amino-4-deoxy-L-arabinose transferase-like glycosyltransferase